MSSSLSTSEIKEWRSIIVLIIFVLTNAAVLFPFHIPIPVPWSVWNGSLNVLSNARIIQPRRIHHPGTKESTNYDENNHDRYKWLRFPMNFLTAPLIAVLFLLALTAIGRTEVYDGTVGTDHIYPLEIMAFFISLAYIAISIDASGSIRWLALKVLQKGGSSGHLLYLYLYLFFFGLASLIGNDPIVLSGTPFLAYMTRLSSNIREPKAWIFTQFSVANIASAILVSSNPTNLVLAGAFSIKFVDYTENMIVPVIITVIFYFPFLLYYAFRDEGLIPKKIEMHESPTNEKKEPTNPNIPYAGGITEDDKDPNTEKGKLLGLEEIMNPYLDKKSAIFGAVLMAITLTSILVLNASSSKEYPAFYVTVPAAVIMLCWDLVFGWKNRHKTRKISREGWREIELRHQQEVNESSVVQEDADAAGSNEKFASPEKRKEDAQVTNNSTIESDNLAMDDLKHRGGSASSSSVLTKDGPAMNAEESAATTTALEHEQREEMEMRAAPAPGGLSLDLPEASSSEEMDEKLAVDGKPRAERSSLSSLGRKWWFWARETFPTTTSVLAHLPLPLVPFGLCMFVLVEALVTKGWILVFAYGWNHWVDATGTVGAIGGMGFLAVIFCNIAGTNIGTTILLCRVVQEWYHIRQAEGPPITDRTFWATVYSMAIGLNYGAFSIVFSASLAGMLWRTILARKHIHVRGRDFLIVNIRLIAFAMIIGCAVLVGEVYIFQKSTTYHLGSTG